ncbi:MAG: cytochrome c1 [Gammaproteobacteria bacterium]|nr:cytochrome c1 [Gammaproteobacteria bacterium]
MRKLITALLLAVAPSLVFAAGGGIQLDHANIDVSNKEAIQRGAKTFVNYCLSCHSAAYMRYNRLGADAGMTDQQLKDNLIFTRNKKGEQTKVGELMKNAMTEDYAKEAFGTKVPDLTVIARSRGTDWLYTYLRTFYVDAGRPSGHNNKAFPDVGMPNVLWEMQGVQQAEIRVDDKGSRHVESLSIIKPGTHSVAEFDQVVNDLVTYLAYMGEPMQLERQSIGFWTLGFLLIFFVVAYMLKKEYWKDVH